MNYFLVTAGHRQMDRPKAMHKSPPCISTGGFQNWYNHNLEELATMSILLAYGNVVAMISDAGEHIVK